MTEGQTKTIALKKGTKKIASGVKWKSSDKKVVTVSKGKLKAKKAGKVTVTATYKKKSYTCKVTVKAKAVPDPDEQFYITLINDSIFARIYGKSFKEDCTVPRSDLRYVHVLHRDIDGNTHEGEMIVNKHIADDVLEILHELYKNDYPIEKMVLVDEYGAVDELSMEDNNSSSFNFRLISHTTRVSKHGFGLAVDINTLYNPYHKIVTNEDGSTVEVIEPATGAPYLDRTKDFDYKIVKGDLCCNLFIEHGFEWGGEWPDRKDYQHFEIPVDKIEEWYPGYSD